MSGFRSSGKWLWGLAIGLIVLSVFSVKRSLDIRRWKGSFQNEMAQRLDLEEKISRFENERAAWQKQEALLKAQLEDVKRETDALQASLEKEKTNSKKSLEELVQNQTKDQVQNETIASAPADQM